VAVASSKVRKYFAKKKMRMINNQFIDCVSRNSEPHSSRRRELQAAVFSNQHQYQLEKIAA
jgi:hypothetical protein